MILCMPKLVKKGKDTHERQIMARCSYGCYCRNRMVWRHTRRSQTTSMAIIWYLFSLTIVGLVLKPFPVPITVLLGCCYIFYFIEQHKDVLAGYSNTALWLIFAAFALSVAFGKTGLGHRIAYHLVRLFGSTTLRLGYVTAFLDLILSPATPSNTARAAGIVYPINLSIAGSGWFISW